MDLSVREAATLMGRSPRTVRSQLARGELRGVKRGGGWWVDRMHLPLTEAQREALLNKADGVRDAVEDALATRTGRRSGRFHSVADLDAFRLGAEVLASFRAAGPRIEEWLMVERGLRLKHPRARILSCHGHLDALGYRIRRDAITCLKRPLRRLHRRIRQHMAGHLDVDLKRSIASSVGILLF